MPSSPKGPCRAGKTASAPSSPPPARSATSSPSHDQLPSRASSTHVTSWPAAVSPSRTDAAELSETSCSDERPPARTATLTGSSARARRAVPPVVVPSGFSAGLNLPTTIVTLPPFLAFFPAAGLCSMTTPSPSGVGTSRLCWSMTKPWRRALLIAAGASSPVTSGTATWLGALATVSATVVPESTWLPPLGFCESDGARVLVGRLLVRARDLEPGRLQGRLRLVEALADDVGDLDLRLAAGDDERDRRALVDLLALGRADRDHPALRHRVGVLLALGGLQAGLLQSPARRGDGQADHLRHRHLLRAVGDRQRHRRALLGLRPARRVLPDDLALGLLGGLQRRCRRWKPSWRSLASALAWSAPTTVGTLTFCVPGSSSTAARPSARHQHRQQPQPPAPALARLARGQRLLGVGVGLAREVRGAAAAPARGRPWPCRRARPAGRR